jgi:hypothetical protein
MWSKSAMRVDAGTSIALSAQAREDFHEQTALEAVITFLRQYGCPRQMTFDRDPRLSLEGCQVGIFPLRCVGFCCAWASFHTSARHIAQTKMPTWRGFTGPTGKNAYTFITQAHCRRCVRSQRRSSSITIMNAPIRDGPVAMSLRVSLFRHCQHYQLFQHELIRMPGLSAWIRRCICVMWAEMAV